MTLFDGRSPEEHLAWEEARWWVAVMVAMLAGYNRRMAGMLVERFGMGGCDESTLRAIGERFEVSQSRVEQVVAAALRRLRRTMLASVRREDY